MIIRILTLVLLLISASGCEVRRGVEEVCGNDYGQYSKNNGDAFQDYIHSCNCVGLATTNDAPALRTSPSQRNFQRSFEKRKLLLDTLFSFLYVNNYFKRYYIERLSYCHLSKSGRPLLYFLCKLSI